MSQRDDLDERLSAWLVDEGSAPAPQRLRDAVDARLAVTGQSSRWIRWPASIGLPMRGIAPVAATAAVVGVLVVLVALSGLGAVSERATASPPAVPSPSASPSGTTAASPAPTPAGVILAAGTARPSRLTPSLEFRVPAGWTLTEDVPAALQIVPPGAGVFVQPNDGQPIFDSVTVFIDPLAGAADGATTPDRSVGTDASALSHWLAARPQLIATAPSPTTLAGLHGFVVDAGLSPAAGGLCGVPCVNLFDVGGEASGIQFGMLGRETIRAIVLDRPGGGTVLILIDDADGADVATFRAAAMSVIQTFRFSGP